MTEKNKEKNLVQLIRVNGSLELFEEYIDSLETKELIKNHFLYLNKKSLKKALEYANFSDKIINEILRSNSSEKHFYDLRMEFSDFYPSALESGYNLAKQIIDSKKDDPIKSTIIHPVNPLLLEIEEYHKGFEKAWEEENYQLPIFLFVS